MCTGSRWLSQPDPPPLEVAGWDHQVWSTVLGTSLMKIGSGGYGAQTNIYAGGAKVAEKLPSMTVWTTADPVAGTSARMYVWNNGTYADLEQSEPLGQRISSISPPEEGYPSYTAYKGNVGEPEWQCEAPREFYGSGVVKLFETRYSGFLPPFFVNFSDGCFADRISLSQLAIWTPVAGWIKCDLMLIIKLCSQEY